MTEQEMLESLNIAITHLNKVHCELNKRGNEPNLWDRVHRALHELGTVRDKLALRLEVVAYECDGHPAGPFDPMGETVYCDGSCKRGKR